MTVAALVLSACAAPGSTTRHDAIALTGGGDPEHGKTMMIRYGCGACHTIPGVPGARAIVGPNLAGIASRAYVGGVTPNTPDNLMLWIRDPRLFDTKTAMPPTGVTPGDARDIAAYLYMLR